MKKTPRRKDAKREGTFRKRNAIDRPLGHQRPACTVPAMPNGTHSRRI